MAAAISRRRSASRFEEVVASDRPPAARRLVQPDPPRELQRGVRARRAAHRPRQADPRRRDQRHDRSGRSDPPRRRRSSSDQLSVFVDLRARTRARARSAATQIDPDPAASGRRAGAHRALGELPQGREHPITSATSCSAPRSSCCARRTSARSRSPRSRKCSRATGCQPRHAPGELAAGEPAQRRRRAHCRSSERAATSRSESVMRHRNSGRQLEPQQPRIARRCSATWRRRCSARDDPHDRCPRRRSCAAWPSR